MRIAALYRYPVKGLSPEAVGSAALERGGHMPGDRLFAIENGPSGFKAEAPIHQPKIKFLMLMKQAALARLATRYDATTSRLSVSRDGDVLADENVDDPEGEASLLSAIAAALPAGDVRGRLRLLRAPEGFRFTDSARGYLSVLNLASVDDLGRRMGVTLDPLRFRANIHVEGLEPWAELDLVGARLQAPTRLSLSVTARIDRCAATGVNPTSGARDAAVVDALRNAFGHIDCGVYVEVTDPGVLAVGQRLDVMPAQTERESLGLR
jgi:hypothetical protein